jgi:hypothetical protein
LPARFFARVSGRLFGFCFLPLKNKHIKKQKQKCRMCAGAKTVTAKRAEGRVHLGHFNGHCHFIGLLR